MSKFIKRYWYNIPSDIIISLLLVITILFVIMPINCIFGNKYLDFLNLIVNINCIFIMIRLVWLYFITPKIGINKRLKIFCISRSVYNRNKCWINQRNIVKQDKNKCILRKLNEEKKLLLEILSDGKTYYCHSHAEVKELLEKNNFIFIKCEQNKEKSMDKIRKFLVKNNCKNCPRIQKRCPLHTDERKIFYNMKFKKNI